MLHKCLTIACRMKGISKRNAFASKCNISAGVFSVYVTKVALWLALKRMVVCLASTKVKKGIHSRTKLARVRLILDVSDLCSKHNEANHKRFSNTP